MDNIILGIILVIVFVGSFNKTQARINRLSFWLNGNMSDFNSGIDLVFIIRWLLSPKFRLVVKREREMQKREQNIENLYKQLKREEDLQRKADYIKARTMK